MGSSESTSGEGSLFEGMVLFSSSDQSPSPPPSVEPSPPSLPASDAPISQSKPLDEDLFSDLTLQVPTPSLSPPQSPSKPTPPATSATVTPSPLRQVSRKKKRAVRIGYARDAVSIDDEPHLPSSTTAFSSSDPLPPIFSQEVTAPQPLPPTEPSETSSTDSSLSLAVHPQGTSQSESEIEQHDKPSEIVDRESSSKEEECTVETTSKSGSDNSNTSVENEERCDSIEQKLAVVRAKILKRAELARQRAVLVTAKRKELAVRRRNVGEELNKALSKHKELERELEEACEAEDFERAERISYSLASVENDKNQLLLDLRSAELDYESVESDLQDVLDLHIAAEEEAASLLEVFAKVQSFKYWSF